MFCAVRICMRKATAGSLPAAVVACADSAGRGKVSCLLLGGLYQRAPLRICRWELVTFTDSLRGI